MISEVVFKPRRSDQQTQPVLIHVPLDVFQLLLSAGNSANPPRSAQEILIERIATPGLSILGHDVRGVVERVAELEGVRSDTLIAEWVRKIVEDEYRIEGAVQ